MFRMDTNRRVATLAVVMVLSLGSPLAAAGWEMPARWTDSGDFLRSFTRVLTWLGVTPVPGVAQKCDRGSSIDPNGICKSALVVDGRGSLDSNGATLDAGSGIDPYGLH
jgi:hypothetical protein